MRNLKKILALVLALVMSLSLMATASAAEATSANADPYATAEEVLKGLDVFKGDAGTGDYRFNETISRSETAALIYRIATGDVKDTQAAIYTNHPFTDVVANHWATGYISYCYNAEYVKGNGDGTFSPDSKVTGYATLAMILRAMGYGKNGEFEGDGWEIRTASTAKQIGILDKISDAQLGGDAPRSLVAQILFRALLTETVEFDARMPYQYPTTGETLGYKQFGLEELEGVVVANEFANLYGTSVLANGKTNLEITKDDVRSLDVATDLTDMGERQHVYITGSTVLSMDNTGLNTTKENDGAAVVIDTAAKFQAAAGMPAAADIEYFVNFDRVGTYTCDQRLEFRVTFQNPQAMASFDTYAGVDVSAVAAADNLDDNLVGGTVDNNWTVNTAVLGDWATNETTETPAGNLDAAAQDYIFANADYPVTFKKVIRAGNDISDADLAVIRGIFGVADNTVAGTTPSIWAKDQVTGDVFVGTASTNNAATDEERDLSNQIGYNKFFEQYINAEVYDVNWDRADNGEWVKFIDNDNDGAADYAFLTTSNMDEVLSTYTKDGATVTEYYTFSDDADNWYSVRYLGDVPAVGDVVLYTMIDGQLLVESAASETVKVTDYSWKDDQIETDKGTFGQSGIENWTEMMELISAMKDGTSYDVYFDHFGYIRAYEIPGGNTYALVTEIYARNQANGNLVQEWPMNVELVIKDADAKEYNLVGGGSNLFVSGAAWAQIENLAAQGNYYNWLQPAIAHLGVTRTVNGFNLGPAFILNSSNQRLQGFTAAAGTSTYWPANRQIVQNLSAINDGTFDYGEQNYRQLRVNTWDVEQGATASFTNIAIVNIDGDNATLEGAARVRTDNRNSVMTWPNSGNYRYASDYIQLSTANVVAGQARYPIFGDTAVGSYAAENNYYVNATKDTEFYVAYNGDVLYKVGYANMVALTNADNRIHAAYAVAHDTAADDAGLPYWVADVIVYEVATYADATTTGVSLAYYNPSRNDQQVQLLDTLSDKATPADVDLVPENLTWNADGGQFNQYSGYGFYLITNPSAVEDGKMSADGLSAITNRKADGTLDPAARNFNKNGIFAGTIIRVYELAGSSYIDINTDNTTNSDGTLKTNVSLQLNNNIYSITEEVVNEGTWNEITRNVAKNLRYDGRAGFVQNSQVKPNDRVIWVGKAPTNGTVGSSNFIVDLGNDILAGSDANFDLHAITPDWLFNRTDAADGVVGDINELAHGWGLWTDIMTEQITGPAPTVYGRPVVQFFNKTETYTTLTDSIDYSAAVASNQPTITVTFDKDNKAIANVTVDGEQATQNGLVWTWDETVPTSTKTYTVAVTYQNGKDNSVETVTWNLTVETANSGARFEQDAANGPVKSGTTITLPASDPYPTLLAWLQNSFKLSNGDSKEADESAADANDTANSAGAKVEWTICIEPNTIITGEGVGSAIKLSTSAYNETSTDTVSWIVAKVTSENGENETTYSGVNQTTTPTIPDKYTKFIVKVGEGITVTNAGTGTWNAATRELSVPYGNTTFATLEAVGGGTFAATPAGNVTAVGEGFYVDGTGKTVWYPTFTGAAEVTFTPDEGGLNVNATVNGAASGDISWYVKGDPDAAAKVGDTIVVHVGYSSYTHVAAKVEWSNGTGADYQNVVLPTGTYNDWEIDTSDMVAGDLNIDVTLIAYDQSLSVTNSSTYDIVVKYTKVTPNAADPSASTLVEHEITLAPGQSLDGDAAGTTDNGTTFSATTVVEISMKVGPGFVFSGVTPAGSAVVANAPRGTWTSQNVDWNSGLVTGGLDITVADIPTT